VNVIFVAGRVAQDAELKQTGAGKPVLNFKVVTNVGYGEKRHPLWIDCSLWGARAEKLASYITKGKPVTVHGTFDIRAYTGKNGPGASITCDVADVELQGGGQQETAAAPQGQIRKPEMTPGAWDDEPIPF
jgi:single-strand DNA-binding protein